MPATPSSPCRNGWRTCHRSRTPPLAHFPHVPVPCRIQKPSRIRMPPKVRTPFSPLPRRSRPRASTPASRSKSCACPEAAPASPSMSCGARTEPSLPSTPAPASASRPPTRPPHSPAPASTGCTAQIARNRSTAHPRPRKRSLNASRRPATSVPSTKTPTPTATA